MNTAPIVYAFVNDRGTVVHSVDKNLLMHKYRIFASQKRAKTPVVSLNYNTIPWGTKNYKEFNQAVIQKIRIEINANRIITR